MEHDKSATPFFRSMHDLSKEVNQMKKEGQKEDPRRRFEEEVPSTSYQQIRKLETHETLSLYLEEYKE